LDSALRSGYVGIISNTKKMSNKYKTIILSIILGLFPIQTFAFTVPAKPTSFVSDYAGMMSASQVSDLENKISQFEKQTTNEIAVVTVPSLDGEPIENLAQEIFTKWGIGKKDKNNGVLLLISLADRKTRIQTGYGVEGDLTDIGTSYIQSEVITPAFRAGDYYAGIDGAVDKMITALGGADIVPSGYSQNNNSGNNNNFWGIAVFFAFMFLQISVSVLARSKSWWAGGVLGAIISVIIIFATGVAFVSLASLVIFVLITGMGLIVDYSVSKAYTAGKFKSGPGGFWWFGGGRGPGGFGGSSGGGFGGFGGGGSGGGGSSGSW
jgi:uncharacterized protein